MSTAIPVLTVQLWPMELKSAVLSLLDLIKFRKKKTISDTRTTGTDKQLIAKYNGFPFGTPTSSHQSPHHAQYQCGEGLDFAVIKDCQKHVFTELRNISKGPTMHPVKYMQ